MIPVPGGFKQYLGAPFKVLVRETLKPGKKVLEASRVPSRSKFCDSIKAAMEKLFNLLVKNYIIYIDIHTYMCIKKTKMPKVAVSG